MSVAQIKRFVERFNADPRFRTAFAEDPCGQLRDLGTDLSPEDVRPVWDAAARGDASPPTGRMAEYRTYYREKVELNATYQERCTPDHPGLRAWRRRQIERLADEVIDANASVVVHSPVTFELSRGCSVGCYFCSLDAQALTAVFADTPENRELWIDALDAVGEILGESAGRGFCYWATDPLDNPDYEAFAALFAERLGRFPQTTTAKPLDDPARTRDLLALSLRYTPNLINRFSLATAKALRDVHRHFTADELRQVEMVTLNPESDSIKTRSGRFYQLCKEKPKVWEKEVGKLRKIHSDRFSGDEFDLFIDSLRDRTCSCVSGFLINMSDRTLKLISPCVPDDEHPTGFYTYAAARFTDGADLRDQLGRMVETHAREELDPKEKLAFRPGLAFELTPAGFRLSTRYREIAIEDEGSAPLLRFIGSRLDQGGLSADAIGVSASFSLGVHPVVTTTVINQIFQKGLLDERPRALRASPGTAAAPPAEAPAPAPSGAVAP